MAYTPAQEAARRLALAKTGTATNIMIVGDSIGEGAMCNGLSGAGTDGDQYIDLRFQTQAVQDLQQFYMGKPGGIGYVNPESIIYAGVAPAASGTCYFTYSGGGANDTTTAGLLFGGRTYTPTTNETTTIHYTGTSIKIHFSQGTSASGQFTVATDGGTAVTVTPGTTGGLTADGFYSTAVFFHGTHTVVITPASGKIAYIRGCQVYDGDETGGIHMWDNTHGGWETANMLGASGFATQGSLTANGLNNTLSSGLCADPALVIFQLGVNDYRLNDTSAATFLTNMQTIMNNINTVTTANYGRNPVYLSLVMFQTAAGATVDPFSSYVTATNTFISNNSTNCFGYDLSALFPLPGAGNNYDNGNFRTDAVHPSTAGHLNIGQLIASVICSTPNPEAPGGNRGNLPRHVSLGNGESRSEGAY